MIKLGNNLYFQNGEDCPINKIYFSDNNENLAGYQRIELNNGRVANTIANETGCKAMQIQTLHNVSLDDFNNGETWVSLMKKNVDVLKVALQ